MEVPWLDWLDYIYPFSSSQKRKLGITSWVLVLLSALVFALTGKYKSDRGAHVYWLEKGTSDLRPDHILNLIHYEVSNTYKL